MKTILAGKVLTVGRSETAQSAIKKNVLTSLNQTENYTGRGLETKPLPTLATSTDDIMSIDDGLNIKTIENITKHSRQ